MLITTTDLLNSGLLVSEEISDNRLERAIQIAELAYVKPRLGDEMYISLLDEQSTYYTLINGGVVEKDGKQLYIAGLKEVEYHIAFANLLKDNVNATTFQSVLKVDDYSKPATKDEIMESAVFHWTIGNTYMNEILDYLDINVKDKWLPDYFNELL